jgi:Domain of unknown function (DUF4333)
MSGPQGQDPNQPWSPGQPEQQPPGSEEPTAQAGWHEPAYAPTQYGQPQPYSGTPQPPPPGQDFGQQPIQYGPTEQMSQQPTQYGQPGQYQPPQYGQQFPPTAGYGQPPGQYIPPGAQYGEAPAAFGQAEAAKSSRSSLAILSGIVGVLVVIVVAVFLVMGFWKPGFLVTTKLDVNKAQQGVHQILTDQTNGYGVKRADNIKCNIEQNGQNPTVKKGEHFTCDVSVDGQHKQVTVTFLDNNGTYEVGRPK